MPTLTVRQRKSKARVWGEAEAAAGSSFRRLGQTDTHLNLIAALPP